MEEYIIGITGASGSRYALRTAEALLEAGGKVSVIATEMGRRVLEYEMGFTLEHWAGRMEKPVFIENCGDLFSPLASGSHTVRGMAVIPCSMSSLGELASGITTNLLTRAADVMLKQKRTLAIVPRETPLSALHLKNMLALSECGAHIIPAMPAFYSHPETLDDITAFMAGKVLDCFGIENNLYKRWDGPGKIAKGGY